MKDLQEPKFDEAPATNTVRLETTGRKNRENNGRWNLTNGVLVSFRMDRKWVKSLLPKSPIRAMSGENLLSVGRVSGNGVFWG